MSAAAVGSFESVRTRFRGGGVAARVLRRPSAALAALVVALLVFCTLFAPLVAPYAQSHSDYDHLFAAPSFGHLFGTDELGRDLLSRVLYGGRTSLEIAFLATLVAIVFGATDRKSVV